MHCTKRACSRAALSAGSSSATSSAMMLMTTSSSMRVNARDRNFAITCCDIDKSPGNTAPRLNIATSRKGESPGFPGLPQNELQSAVCFTTQHHQRASSHQHETGRLGDGGECAGGEAEVVVFNDAAPQAALIAEV